MNNRGSEKGADLGSSGGSALTWAAYGGHLEVVRYLVGEGYDDKWPGTSTDDYYGDRALAQAARGGHLEVVRFLVEEGFEMNPTHYAGSTGRGDTPLIYAAHGGHLEVVRLLVEKGADIHMRTDPPTWSEIDRCIGGTGHHFWYPRDTFYDPSNEGCTALIAATQQGHPDVVAVLIDHWMSEAGADDADAFGATALMFSAQIGDFSRARTLVDNGANIHAETKAGFNAFLLAVHSGDLETIRYFLSLGSDINNQTPRGSTAVMFAAYLGHVDSVRLLIENGADVDAQTRRGYVGEHTALMGAAFSGHLDVVRLLVENGADIDLTDLNGNTALFWATWNGHQEVASYLSSL